MTAERASALPPAVAAESTIRARLTAIRYGASDINFYEFATVDGRPLPAAEPGAHIGLVLPNGMLRQYSLIGCGEAPNCYVIGVKREKSGRGGSTWLHDEARVGAVIEIAPPRNNFPLNEAAPHSVLIAGGIGVTPLYSMMRRLEALSKPWTLYYSCRTRGEALFLDELTGRGNVHLHFDDEAGGVAPVGDMVANAPVDAHLYCCGPGPMLKAFEQAAASRAPHQVHVEYFTPQFEAANEGGFTVELARAKRSIRVGEGQSILQALLEAGLDLPHSCEEGVCGACETRVIEGVPDHRDSILSTAERAANKTMMICCSGCKSDKLVLDI